MEICKVVEGKSGRFFKGCPWIWKALKAGNTEGVKIYLEGVEGLTEEMLSERLLDLYRAEVNETQKQLWRSGVMAGLMSKAPYRDNAPNNWLSRGRQRGLTTKL